MSNQYIATFDWHSPNTPLSSLSTAVGSVAVYLACVFIGQRAMAQRRALQIKSMVAVHNGILCVASAVMLMGIVTSVYPALTSRGFVSVFCDSERRMVRGQLVFWLYCFYLSKYYELLDTALLVLRKKPIEFLHVFHHSVTLLTCWVGLHVDQTNQWCAAVNNTAVHTAMYYYYCQAARGNHVWWKRYLTIVQMIQFWVNIVGLFYWLYLDMSTPPNGCAGERWAFVLCVTIVMLFFILFQRFYKKAYKKKPSRKST